MERVDGRISDVLKTNCFDSALDLEQTLMRYVHLFNTQVQQSALGSRMPMQAMKGCTKHTRSCSSNRRAIIQDATLIHNRGINKLR